MAHDVTIVPLGPFIVSPGHEAAPTSMDARCARLAFQPKNGQIVCCARGAWIDVRAKLRAEAHGAAYPWSDEGPMQHDAAPSGVVQRLADVRASAEGATIAQTDEPRARVVTVCGALQLIEGGTRGEGCALRQLARMAQLREDAWLLDDCALFPLDLRDGELVPSPRIDASLLVEATNVPSLVDEARARIAIRFGEEVARGVEEAARALRGHHPRAVHLKTLK